MQTVRYVVEYLPRAEVRRVYSEHKAEIDGGASIWDFAFDANLAQERDWTRADTALAVARALLSPHEFHEVQLREEHRVPRMCPIEWRVKRRAFVRRSTDTLTWVDVE